MDSGYSSQIAEKIKALQAQNDAMEKEKEEADKMVAEQGVVSNPVVEQVKPAPKKKKNKKKVSVQKTDISRALESVTAEQIEEQDRKERKAEQKKKDSEPAASIKPPKEPEKEPPREAETKPRAEAEISPVTEEKPATEEVVRTEENSPEKDSRAALSASFRGIEEMFDDEDHGKAPKSTVSIAGEEAKKLREEIRAEIRRELELEAEKKTSTEDMSASAPRHRGPHAIIQRRVRYVDTSGQPLRAFCLIDQSTGEVIELKDNAVVGKNEMSDIIIPNRYVSRRHARFTCEGGEFYVEDLGSTNGTFVEGERVDPGSGRKKIEIGNTITFAACRYTFDVLR